MQAPVVAPAQPAKPADIIGNVSGKVTGDVVGLAKQADGGGHGGGGGGGGHGAKEEPARPVVYVDEQGNPVEKPVDPQKMMEEAERLIKFVEALPSWKN